MQYFVTGATGFIGSYLVRVLVDEGHDVIAIARQPDQAMLPESVDLVQGDITSKESMRDAMSRADRVFHLAAWYRIGVDDPGTAYRVNVEGTQNVLELMAELDIEKGVYTSSLAVFSDTGGALVDESYRYDGPHLSMYDQTKWQAHYEVAAPMIADGLPLVIVQPGLVYGPGDRGPAWSLWSAYLRDDLPFIPRQSGYCWGHVADTVDGITRALDRGTCGESYIIAGEAHTLEDVFALAATLTEIPAPRTVHPAVFQILSHIVAPVERIVTIPPEYTAEALRVLGGVTYWGDNTKANRELGLRHRPLAEGLQETLLAARDELVN